MPAGRHRALIHATAIVDPGAQIGEGTNVWHWVHVTGGAVIGSGCSLGQNVYVAGGARVANNVRIQNNVSVYDGVSIEDDVFCGPSVVFTNVRNPRAAIPRKNEYLPTIVKRGATIGANATIICGNTVGEYAFVAAGAVVARDVLAYSMVAGVPARAMGWMSQAGERLDLPLGGEGEARCPATGDLYRLELGRVTKISRV